MNSQAKEPASAEVLVASARALIPRIAEGAASRDANGEVPLEAVGWLREAGITAAHVPREYGGPGATFVQLAEIVLALGEADPNVAQALQPHFAFHDVLSFGAPENLRRRCFAQILDGAIITNALAERGGKFIGDIATTATRVDGGYRLDGTKFYCTGSFAADAFWVLSGTALDERMIAVVPLDREGVTVEDDWDAMGQRTTASGTARFDQVFVSDDEIMASERVWMERNFVGAAAQLSHTAIDAGIAMAALQEAVDYVRTRGRPMPESGVERLGDDPYVLETIGEMRVEAVSSRAVVLNAASTLDAAASRQLAAPEKSSPELERDLAAASIAVAEAKIASTRSALRNTELLFQVGGASMAARSLNLDRHWRNARTHTIHDPVSYKYRAVGEFVLNERYPTIGTKI